MTRRMTCAGDAGAPVQRGRFGHYLLGGIALDHYLLGNSAQTRPGYAIVCRNSTGMLGMVRCRGESMLGWLGSCRFGCFL